MARLRPAAATKSAEFRRRVAIIGVVAILLQAILFGWHHHPPMRAAHGTQPIALAKSTAPLSPAMAEDGCDLCAALHHLSASPVGFTALAPPAATPSGIYLRNLALADRDLARPFQARAPPRA